VTTEEPEVGSGAGASDNGGDGDDGTEYFKSLIDWMEKCPLFDLDNQEQQQFLPFCVRFLHKLQFQQQLRTRNNKLRSKWVRGDGSLL